MTRKHAAFAAAVAAFLSAPVFAQSCDLSSSNLQMNCPSTSTLGAGPSMSSSTVTNSSGTSVSSGTGVIVSQGAAPAGTVVVTPAGSLATEHTHLLPGGTTVQRSQTTVLGGPAAGGVTGTQTIVTRYWVNVPRNVENRGDFQRWMNLK